MKIYHTVGGQYLIHGHQFLMGTVILELDNGYIIACERFNSKRTQDLFVRVYYPSNKKWVKCYLKNRYTDLMWEYYSKNKKRIVPKKSYKKKQVQNKIKSGTKKKNIPKSVMWAASHPFQGGGMTPR